MTAAIRAPAWGENIGLASLVGGPNLVGMVEKLFDVLFDSPTHRANTMATVYTDLGLAVRTGDFQGVSVGVVTEVFGVSDHDGPILTAWPFRIAAATAPMMWARACRA